MPLFLTGTPYYIKDSSIKSAQSTSSDKGKEKYVDDSDGSQSISRASHISSKSWLEPAIKILMDLPSILDCQILSEQADNNDKANNSRVADASITLLSSSSSPKDESMQQQNNHHLKNNAFGLLEKCYSVTSPSSAYSILGTEFLDTCIAMSIYDRESQTLLLAHLTSKTDSKAISELFCEFSGSTHMLEVRLIGGIGQSLHEAKAKQSRETLYNIITACASSELNLNIISTDIQKTW